MLHLTRTLASLFSLSLLTLGSACVADGDASSGDGGGAGGKADQIDPVGDDDAAMITVVAPSNLPAATNNGNPVTTRARLEGNDIELGETYRRRAGEMGIEVWNGGARTEMRVDAQVGNNEFRLAGFTATWDAAKVAVDAGPRAALEGTYKTPYDYESPLSMNGAYNEQRTYLVTPGNTYTLGLGIHAIPTKTFTLNPGQVKTIDLVPTDVRATLRIHAPARSFPDATACATTHNYLSSTAGAEPIDLTNDAILRVFPYVAADGNARYDLVSSGVYMTLAPQAGQTTDVYVKRLDINDVRLTREDGSTYMQPGTYVIEQQLEDGSWMYVRPDSFACGSQEATFPTRTGVDVPPGTYRVTVSYGTPTGTGSYVRTITL